MATKGSKAKPQMSKEQQAAVEKRLDLVWCNLCVVQSDYLRGFYLGMRDALVLAGLHVERNNTHHTVTPEEPQ